MIEISYRGLFVLMALSDRLGDNGKRFHLMRERMAIFNIKVSLFLRKINFRQDKKLGL